MTPSRFAEILEAYGAAPQRWPEAERDAALALVERSAEIRAQLSRAAALDTALDRWTDPPMPHIDARALTAVVTAAPQRRIRLRTPFRFGWPSIAWPNVAGLAAAALAGFLVGWSGLDGTLSSETNYENPDRAAVAAIVEDATW